MYVEFVVIYVGLGVLALLTAAVLVLLLLVLRRMKAGGAGETAPRLVFCNRCGNRFDAATGVCPKCGTPR